MRLDAELWNLTYPQDQRIPAEIVANYSAVAEGSFERHLVISEDGRELALLIALDPEGKAKPEIVNYNVLIRPEHEERIFPEAAKRGEALAQEVGADRVSTWISDDQKFRESFLEGGGYTCIQAVPVTRLDLSDFDSSPYQSVIQKLRASGIRVASAAELDAEGTDWIPKLHVAAEAMMRDVPFTHEPPTISLERYREMLQDRATYDFRLMFMALDGYQVVGYSRVSPALGMRGLVRTGLSGVLRSHRRRGIVTALKVTGIERLRALGYRWLQTDNDETNPMYQINLRLGFKVAWRWRQYGRSL